MRISTVGAVVMSGLLILSVPEQFAGAGGAVSGRVTFDLTDSAFASKFARWSTPERIGVRDGGIGFDGRSTGELVDGWIETTEPVGVGLMSKAARHVSLTITLPWSRAGLMGHVFVRFGVDGTHWSEWISIARVPKKIESDDPTETFRGSVGVTRREAGDFWARREALPKQGSRRIDEDEAARLITASEPEYFATHRSFVGWIQVLWEGTFSSGARLPSIQIEWSAAIAGPDGVSEDPTRRGPWCFLVKPK